MSFLHTGRTLRRLSLWILFGLALGSGISTTFAGVMVGFPDKEDQQRRPEYLRYDRYRRELARHGFQSDLCPKPLQVAHLKEFNVIVYGGFWDAAVVDLSDPETRKRAAAERQALERYVSSGGGLIVLPMLRSNPGQAIEDYYNLVLEGFGAHTNLSDGQGSVEEYAHAAADAKQQCSTPIPF